MSIAGSDSGAGAGIQADLLTFASHGVYGTTAIAAITAQNPQMVSAVSAPDPRMLEQQMNAIADFYKPKSAKTGMLFDAKIVEVVANFFKHHKEIKLVLDPVMISTSGAKLLKDDAIEMLKTKLLPIAEVITPNLDEAKALLEVDKICDMEKSAKELSQKFGTSVLLKGGHLNGDEICDVLFTRNGDVFQFHSKRIKNIDTHGSGCTLSAAISANLAKGMSVETACKNAQTYLINGMKNPVRIFEKNFINHFPNS
jgi:hydroxymethylpyrimidine/phosphomethylpyrimidine kinase